MEVPSVGDRDDTAGAVRHLETQSLCSRVAIIMS
jgi:hypothetical protein